MFLTLLGILSQEETVSPKEMTEFFLQFLVVPAGSGVLTTQTLLLLPVLQGWLRSTGLLVGVSCAASPLLGVWCVDSLLVGVWYANSPLVGGIQNTGTSLREAALVFCLPVLIGLQLTDLFISSSVF